MPLPFARGQEITTGVLYRRIPPIPRYLDTEEGGKVRPSGLNFMPDTGEPYLSVELRDDVNPEAHMNALLTHPDAIPGSGVFEIDTEALRELGLMVRYEPDHGDRHFGVYGWEAFPKKEAIRVRRKASYRATIRRHPIIQDVLRFPVR